MEDQITQYIQNILQREPAPGEVHGWIAIIEGNVATLEEVRQMIIDTAEAVTNVYPMVLTYQAIYGRVPDADGLEYWTNVYASNLGLDDPATTTVNEALVEVLKPFVDPAQTPEFIDRYGANPTGDQFVAAAYQNVLNRVPDQDGLTYWQTRYAQIEASYADSGMTQDEITVQVRAEILEQFVNSAEYKTATAEEVDAYLTARAEGEDVSGSLWDLDPDANVGQTFTLTQGTDAGANFTGGDADDTFNAPVEQTGLLPIQTLNNTDDLDGMGGWNVLNAQLVNPFTIPLGLTNIQEVNLDGAPGFIVPPVILDVLNANAIEEINFRAPINNITVNNLTTALNTLGLSDSTIAGNVFTVNHTGTATDGTADDLTINLSNNNVGSAIVLTHAGGGANQGYEEITVNSMGGLGNVVAIASTNGPATLNVEGNANLNLGASGILNVATLNTVEAGTFTGDLTATFTGTGDVDVNSGSGDDALNFAIIGNAVVDGNDGDDMLMFGGQANATASGGNGDDLFRFAEFGDTFNEGVSYDVLDSVDGGDGDDVLEIETASGQNLLAAGVGAGIVAVETIRHVSNHRHFNLNVDMAESGSALNLELAGQYSGLDVNVTNLNNEDWVIYSSSGLDDLTLAQAAPDGALDDLHLRLTNGADMDELITGADIEAVTIDVVASTVVGLTANTIASASNLNSDVVITGGGNLEIGTANAYDLDGGLVDASAYTGNLTVHLGTGQQSVIAGVGNDNIVVEAAGAGNGDMIDITSGGLDTVTFEAMWFAGNGLLAPNAANSITKVTGFALDGTDTLALDVPTIVADTTATNTPVAAGDALVLREIAGGEVSNLMGNDFNFLKFTTTVAGALTADDAFNAAIGAGSLTVANDADLLAVVYDVTNQQALVFTVVNFDTTIDAADDAWAITTVGMSQAEYAAWNGEGIVFV